MKFIVFVLAVLAIATYAKAAVVRTAEESTHHPEVAGHSTPRTVDPKVGEESLPTLLEDVDPGFSMPSDPQKEIIRHKRLTCDVFSFSSSAVTPNHAACATKCIAMGRKGGHCDGTTCNCRGDKWIG